MSILKSCPSQGLRPRQSGSRGSILLRQIRNRCHHRRHRIPWRPLLLRGQRHPEQRNLRRSPHNHNHNRLHNYRPLRINGDDHNFTNFANNHANTSHLGPTGNCLACHSRGHLWPWQNIGMSRRVCNKTINCLTIY